MMQNYYNTQGDIGPPGGPGAPGSPGPRVKIYAHDIQMKLIMFYYRVVEAQLDLGDQMEQKEQWYACVCRERCFRA